MLGSKNTAACSFGPEKLEKIRKTFGFNTNQSEIAIGSGRFWGKGWLKGTRSKGDFVPAQDTDYIFTTVGEEWGFVGSTIVIFLFIALLLRILYRAEQQKSKFSRVYGYSVAAILFFHFAINIGMVIQTAANWQSQTPLPRSWAETVHRIR